MRPSELLAALHTAEKLKDTTRHCYTSGWRHESVAEHSWRIALMAFFLRDEFPEADMDKVTRMCLIHDLGECFTGDIPAFDKTAQDESTEEALLSVPDMYREGSFGLGAGRLRTVTHIVLPTAIPGILSGIILAIGRIVGETAALMYTSGTVEKVAGLMDSGSTLALHMYKQASEGLYTEQAYATSVILLALVLVLTGKSVYNSPYLSKAQNRYHIPNSVIAICNEIMPAEEEERVWAVFPQELIYYVRQYTSEVQMPYGREMLEASWEWNWDTHPIYKIMREDTIDLDALSPLLTEYNCQYLILNKSVPYTGDPQKNGLTKIADIEAYELYRNEAVEIAKKKTAPVTCGNPVA